MMNSEMTEPAITPELVAKHNLTPEEYAHVKEILGREPSYTELGIFSVMWSEHCSYKNTRPLLKTFPTKSKKILVGAGEENAGIIDIGDGLAIAFKIESHNHPSAVEPFQGAATGVGGIVRDIFTMGARPVCSVNSLRFGPITENGTGSARAARAAVDASSTAKTDDGASSATREGACTPRTEILNNRRLFAGVVNGIAHYGNCFGIPTIAGEVYFDKSYEGNPLVNAFCLGVLRHEQIARGAARGIGNPVFYVGPATGRDGLAGAAFASQDLTEESAEQQRELGKVPQRAPNMSSDEIMLSESQERMLIIVHKGREEEVKRIFDKWDLPWAEIGFVTDTGRMVVKHHGQVVADIPARKIADESPVYQRESKEPEYLKAVRAFRLDEISETQDAGTDLLKLLAWPTIASKNWVYRQYDHMVRDGSVVCPGSDAAVLRIKGDSLPELSNGKPVPEKLIALTVDCNGAYVYLDPYEGAKAAMAEACRNLACSGAVPLGTTDNLNMPSPLKPELFWQIKESVRGLADACQAFNAPVTGGNCSLYNQSPAGPIDPTPTVAVVGIIEKPAHVTTQWFKNEGDAIILLGDAVDQGDPLQGLGGSAYLQVMHDQKNGAPPRCNLETARTLHTTLLGLIQSGLVRSAHDCSEGGLAVCLAESCISQLVARETPRLVGAQIDLTALKDVRLDALLFGETQSRVVITCKALDEVKVVERAKLMGVPAVPIGRVGGDKLVVKTGAGEFSVPLTELHDVWWNSIARAMG
jgi:phosphoribosylformylglycinamidine synthase subunit PurL